MNRHVILLKNLDEGLDYAVGLRAVVGLERHTGFQIRQAYEVHGDLTAQSQPGLHALGHQISDHLAVYAAGSGHPAHQLPIIVVHGKGHPNLLPVPVGDHKYLGTPPFVAPNTHDGPVTRQMGSARMPLEEQTLDFDDPVDPLGLTGVLTACCRMQKFKSFKLL